MNISTTSSTQAPAPSIKADGPSTRTRAQGDTEQDASTGVAFLSMLQAFTEPGAPSEPADAGPAVLLDTTTPNTAPAALPIISTTTDDAAALHGAEETLAPAGRLPSLRAAPGHRASDDISTERQRARAAGAAADNQGTSDAAAKNTLTGRAARAAQPDGKELAQQGARAGAEASDNTLAQADRGRVAKDPDVALLRPLVPLQASASVVSMFEAGLAGLRGAAGVRGVERGQDRHAAAHTQAGFVAWTDATPTGASHQSASPVYAPTASTPAPSAALAQRMHYWVAGGVQSAELQLDAFGGGSVDVRIAVKGDEAMVAFRSDQPQARQLLLEAMPQLKELLAGEGLVLSGGFVGGSAQQQSGGQHAGRERSEAGLRLRGGQDARAPAAAPAAVRASTGGSVDLFA